MGIFFHFLAQTSNGHPQYFLVVAIFRAPHAGQQFFGCQDLAHVMSELKQKAVFSGGEVDGLVAQPDFGAGKVDAEIVVDKETVGPGFGHLRPAKNRPHTGEQFHHRKWFYQVIIRTHVQAADAVLFLAFGGQHDDGNGRKLTDALAGRKPIHVRQHHVQQNQVHRIGGK